MLEELSECVVGCDGVENTAITQALADSVNTFLAQQSELTRSIFLRRYFFLESAREIGERYGIKANTVNVTLHRTRQKLREHLKKEGYLE